MTTKITPQAFATGTRKLVEETVGPIAKEIKAKALSPKLKDDLYTKRDEPAVKVVLGLTQNAAIIAERVNPAADPNLPPYWIYISARPGKAESGTWIKRDNGMSGFSPDSGSLIYAGKTKIELTDFSGDKVRNRL